MNWVALIVFVVLFGFITWLGFAAARWRRGDLDQLHEWGLGGRRFGTIVTWFLVGGDLYTAYTFIAVPALAFGAGALAFFAVPYTIVIYPILFLVFPRLWYVCHKHGYITAGDFVKRPLRQSLAGTGDHDHRHRRDYAVHRAAAGRHPGRDRGAGHFRHGIRRRSAADHRLRDPGGIYVFERSARTGLDRDRQGHPDLYHRLCRDHRHPDRSWVVSQRSSPPCPRQKLHPRGPRAQHDGRLQHLRDAGPGLGAGALSSIHTPSRAS